MIKNQRDLDNKLKELTSRNQKQRESLFASSDDTRDMAGSVQQGLYFGQLGLSLFRNLTNYHMPMKKRVRKIVVSLLAMVALNVIRKRLQKNK